MPNMTLSDGQLLYYEVQGNGPPLLLVSGLNGVASFWAPHVPAFAERYTVILHDHRGTGRSSHTRMRYSVEQMTDDLVQLMDHLEVPRAHLIGHSTGGAIGQTLALDRPERLDRLVLSATWTAADAYFRRLFKVRSMILETGGPAAYVQTNPLFMNPAAYTRDHEAEIAAAEAVATKAFPPPEVMLSRIEAIVRFDRRAELGRITAPTLVFGARDDIVTPVYYSEELGRLIPNAETVILPDGGHFYPIVHAEAFRDTVLDFLGRGG